MENIHTKRTVGSQLRETHMPNDLRKPFSNIVSLRENRSLHKEDRLLLSSRLPYGHLPEGEQLRRRGTCRTKATKSGKDRK